MPKNGTVESGTGTQAAYWRFPKSYHVGIAAEAIATVLFARCGYDVSVQYGANQPEYDLMIADSDRILKVSVKGSADGGWGLSQTQLAKLRNANYHGAAEAWLQRHKPRTVVCLVQFKDVADDEMPRTYRAWPKEIAERLTAAAGGRGDTILYETIGGVGTLVSHLGVRRGAACIQFLPAPK